MDAFTHTAPVAQRRAKPYGIREAATRRSYVEQIERAAEVVDALGGSDQPEHVRRCLDVACDALNELARIEAEDLAHITGATAREPDRQPRLPSDGYRARLADAIRALPDDAAGLALMQALCAARLLLRERAQGEGRCPTTQAEQAFSREAASVLGTVIDTVRR